MNGHIFIGWLTQKSSDIPLDDGWLTAGEASTLSALRVSKRRHDWRLGRWTAKQAVRAYLLQTNDAGAPQSTGVLPQDLEIRATESGAPEIGGAASRASISLSHSGDTAVCAVAAAGVAVGCDIETIHSRDTAFISDYFTVAERDLLGLASAEEHDRLVTLLWSAKESTLKALREGLRLDTREVEVVSVAGPQPAGWQQVSVRYVPNGTLFFGWWRRDADKVITVVAAPAPQPPVALARA